MTSGGSTPERPRLEFALTYDDLDALFGYVEESLLCCDGDGRITFASSSIRRLLGHDARSSIGRNIVEFLHPDEVGWILEGMARWQGRSGSPLGETIRVRASDGEWVELRYDTVITDRIGPLGSIVVTLRAVNDVDTSTRLLQRRLMNEDRLVRLASAFLEVNVDDFEKGLDNAVRELAGLEWVTRVSVWTSDGTGDRIDLRAEWSAPRGAPAVVLERRMNTRHFKLIELVMRGQEVHLTEPWDQAAGYENERRFAEMSGTTSVLAVPMSSDGQVTGMIMLESTIGDVAHDAGHSTVLRSAAAILAGAFVRHEAEQSLAVQARTDRVTGLGNRWAFDEAVERALIDLSAGRSVGFGLALVDLDRFKLVNDALGHSAGDRLLADVAQRMLVAAEDDTLVARLGGDELLVLVTDSPSVEVTGARIRDLMDALKPPFHLGSDALVITASVGVVHTCDGGIDGEELRRRADVAMYRAKARGGNTIEVDDPDHQDGGDRLLRLETQLREALDHDALDVYFQGEWDLVSGRLVGAEALVRWHHPAHGLLTAAQFVPLAEERGMVAQLGDLVLRKACIAASPWVAQQPDFVLRVNLAADQLRDPLLPLRVAETLEDAGMPPSALCLELTESTLLADPIGSQELLDDLRRHGVGLAIDDFGTGYSSILQLKRLPLTGLKIDRSFVSGLPDSDVDRAIVRSTIGLASTLGLAVTAEGVETDEQRASLLDLGCHLAQGFLLARPEPEVEFERRIR